MSESTGTLLEKEAVIDTLNRLFISVDDRDWAAARECLAPRVLFDVSSMSGEAASTLAADEIIRAWEGALEPLEAVHHQAGNYRVEIKGSEADAFCYGIAYHYLPNSSGENTRLFVGSYDFHLQKSGACWVIDHFKYNLKFIEGNLELEAID